MILNDGEDKKGKFYRAGMIERLSLTLENYASSDWGNRFYQDSFLEGFCARRNEIHIQFGKTIGSLVLFTTLLAFFDSLKGESKFGGLTFSVPELGALALCVLISVIFVSFVLALIEQLTIDKLLYSLGSRIGAHQFEIVLLNFSAKNLWASAVTPKYFGIQSENGHKSVQYILGIFFVVLGIAFISYPVAIVAVNLNRFLSNDPKLIEWILSLVTIVLFSFGFFVLTSFSISYKFRPAKFGEPSLPHIPDDFFELGHPIVPDRKNAAENEEKNSEP